MKEGEFKQIPLSEIDECPWNPRKEWDIDPLAEDLSKRGQLQNITVRPNNGRYEVVSGERRVMSARARKFKSIWAKVRELSDAEAMAITYQENELQKPFTSEEREKLITEMWETGNWKSKNALAEELGIKENTLRGILKAHEDRKDLSIKTRNAQSLSTRDIQVTQGLEKPIREKVLTKIATGKISKHEPEKYVKTLKKVPEPIAKAIIEDKIDVEDVEHLVEDEVEIPKEQVKPAIQEWTKRKQDRDRYEKAIHGTDKAVLKGELKPVSTKVEHDYDADRDKLKKYEHLWDTVRFWSPNRINMIKNEGYKRKAIETLQAVRDHLNEMLKEFE